MSAADYMKSYTVCPSEAKGIAEEWLSVGIVLLANNKLRPMYRTLRAMRIPNPMTAGEQRWSLHRVRLDSIRSLTKRDDSVRLRSVYLLYLVSINYVKLQVKRQVLSSCKILTCITCIICIIYCVYYT